MATNKYLEIHKLLSKKYPDWDFFFNYIGSKTLGDLLVSIPLKSFQTALDLGSGFGGPAIFMAQFSTMSILGIESIKPFCDFATEIVHLINLDKQIQFIQGDFYLIPLAENMYDFIYALDSLLLVNSVRNLNLLFERCWRMLRPGGYFLFTLLCIGENFPLNSDSRQKLRQTLSILLSSNEIRQNLTKHAWSTIKSYDITSSSINYTKLFLKQITSGLSDLNKQALSQFVMDIWNKGIFKQLITQVLSHWAFIVQK
ncbi:MAG: class I SAM-dependent methyltransferase [Candidatus Hodarchaeota archaeon]